MNNQGVSFFHDNFNKKNSVKLSYLNCQSKIHVSNLMHFQGEIVHFFLKNEALRSESVNAEYEKINEILTTET